MITLGSVVLGVLILGNLLNFLTTYYMNKVTYSCYTELSSTLLDRYLNLSYTAFLQLKVSDLKKKILYDAFHVIDNILKPTLLAISMAITACSLIALIFSINFKLAIGVTVLFITAYYACYAMMNKYYYSKSSNISLTQEDRYQLCDSALSDIKMTKIANAEEYFLSRYQHKTALFSKQKTILSVSAQAPRYLLETLAFGTVIAMIIYLLSIGKNSHQVITQLAIYVFAGYRLLPALQIVYASISQIKGHASCLDKISEDHARNTENPKKYINHSPINFKNQIFLNNLSYRYPKSNQNVLTHINLKIEHGSCIGIYGKTGSGKTTLIDLILGLLKPTSGSIDIDGVPLSAENLKSWASKIGYVPNPVVLQSTSLTENIAFGVEPEKIETERIAKVIKLSESADFIGCNSKDTKIGDDGNNLSAGQRQRIALARALYREPSILILDECTSNLDKATESAIIRTLNQLKKTITIIIISHRESTLSICDKVYLIKDNCIFLESDANVYA